MTPFDWILLLAIASFIAGFIGVGVISVFVILIYKSLRKK